MNVHFDTAEQTASSYGRGENASAGRPRDRDSTAQITLWIESIRDLILSSPGNNLIHKEKFAETVMLFAHARSLEDSASAQSEQAIAIRSQTLALAAQTEVMRTQAEVLNTLTGLQEKQIQVCTDIRDIFDDFVNREPPNEFDFAINHVKYSLIADVVAVAAHLMDKIDVTWHSFVEGKIRGDAKYPIAEVRRKLRDNSALQGALEQFENAVATERFDQPSEELDSSVVWKEINQRAGHLLKTMLLIAVAEVDGVAEDWPPPEGQYGAPTARIASASPIQAKRVKGAPSAGRKR